MEVVRGAAGVRDLRAPSPDPWKVLLALSLLFTPSPIHANATVTSTKDIMN